MATAFGGLGLSNVGNESKYFGQATDMPGWLEGAIQVPKAYAAQHWLKPAGEWLENKLKPVPPPAEANGIAPTEFRPDIPVSIPDTTNEAHASSNPWLTH